MDKRYLCYQVIIEDQDKVGTELKIGLDMILRNVGAKNEDEALGKFIRNTKNIIVTKKLDPMCIEIDTLLTID